jgi:hypothetical protein
MQLLSGEATMRVEEPKRVDIFADFSEFLKNLEAEAAAEHAARNVHSETGLADENNLQKALMDGNHEQRSDFENDARNAAIEVDANLVADEPGNRAGETT